MIRSPVCVSHTITVESADAEKIVSLSVDQCTSCTAFLCPLSVMVCGHSPYTSHT